MAEKRRRMKRTPSDSHELSRTRRTISVLELKSPDPASGCAACAMSATAETGMCKQPSATKVEHQAPLGQRKLRQSNTPSLGCQTSDKMELLAIPPCCALSPSGISLSSIK